MAERDQRSPSATNTGSGSEKPRTFISASSSGRIRVMVPPRGPVPSWRTITASISDTFWSATRTRRARMPGVPFSFTAPR